MSTVVSFSKEKNSFDERVFTEALKQKPTLTQTGQRMWESSHQNYEQISAPYETKFEHFRCLDKLSRWRGGGVGANKATPK